MAPRRFIQRLHLDEDLPQTFTHNHSPTQILSAIVKGVEHPTFDDIPKVEVWHPVNNTSTTAAGSSQSTGGASSTQTNDTFRMEVVGELVTKF
jgi:hypothetical protein